MSGELGADDGGRARSVLHVRVEGRVQGVGFRRYVERAAVELALAGWARNLTDGAVEVLAVGASEPLDALRARLEVGPPHGRVARLVDLSGAPASSPRGSGFRLLPDAEPGAPLTDRSDR